MRYESTKRRKGMKKKIFSIMFTLVLVLSFSLIPAVPAMAVAEGTDVTLTVPDNVYRPAEFVTSSTTTNSGTAYAAVRFNITVDGPVDFTGDRANTFTITKVNGSSETQGINDTFTLVGGNWVGYWGPADGFLLTDPYDATSTFTTEMCDVSTAPLGNYNLTVELVDLTSGPDDTLATATDSFSLSADTLYVGTTEYQYQFTTIQSAVDAATAGDTINVAAGTYAESPTTTIPLNIVGVAGAGGALPTLVGTLTINYTGENPTSIKSMNFLVPTITDSFDSISLKGTKNVTIKDCSFDGNNTFIIDPSVFPNAGARAVQMNPLSSNVTIDNCTFRDGYYLAVNGYANLLTVTGSTITNCKSGINLQHGENLMVTDTDISVIAQSAKSDTYCVRFASSTANSGNNMTITGGTFSVNKNDLTAGEDAAGQIYHSAIVVRAGAIGTLKANLLNINGEVVNLSTTLLDASRNWWGDISGPKQADTNPRGAGDEISGNVDYVPWLTRDFQMVLDDNIQYFGFPMVELNTGWNILSTPIALDPACDTWGEYKALGDPDLHIHATNPAYSFNAQTRAFVALTGTYPLKPCDAIYVRMTEPDIAAILYSPDMSVPSKNVYTGWNLGRLAGVPGRAGADGWGWGMPVNEGLASICMVPGSPIGAIGYAQVVSPPMNQESWVCTHVIDGYMGEENLMRPTKGYWVFMINNGTLAGFTFTPMSLGGGD